MHPFENYIRHIQNVYLTGEATPETSYYGALEHLLNEIGKTVKPKVICVISTKNRGAGLPDGGLFTQEQIRKEKISEDEVIKVIPARGAIEVKPVAEDVSKILYTEQVQRYLERYSQVLVTTYRDFVFIGKNKEGKPARLESYTLAKSEDEFWSACYHPRKMKEEHGEALIEFLKRILLHSAILEDPEDVAWFLASYARSALAQIEKSELPALKSIREGLEEALGLKFEGDKGDHFFRSTLVQTLFYGVFSAWVLWHEKQQTDLDEETFNWRMAAWHLRVPMIRTLYELVARPTKLGSLGLEQTLDLVASTLNRVSRRSFFEKFLKEQAVQYFYEPFLKAFDPQLRKELGIWYTPPEIVEYMVKRVDTVLREELDIEDGLADRRVYVLDPCCGTGAYLIQVLKEIQRTLREKGADALTANDIKRTAMERVFGFEILPAPFVISHLQLGLFLQDVGAPLSEEKNERAAVYLTNALTGWEPPKAPKTHLLFPEMEEERDAAERVKRQTPILVVLGNPPYNAFAGVSTTDEERDLIKPYKEDLIAKWGIKKFNLDDLYVRFLRLAERRIAEQTGQGVVCYISNFSYLRDASFVVMRERFLREFDKLWFDCMNGDSRETGKTTPEGKPDPSVFSTKQNKAGIRVGTSIGLMVRKQKRDRKPVVRFRHFWGVNKRRELLESLLVKKLNSHYEISRPEKSNRFSFRPVAVHSSYLSWPKLTDLCAEPPCNGLMEKRGGALIDIDSKALEKRMRMYYDENSEWEHLKSLVTGLTRDAARFKAKDARKRVIASEKRFNSNNIQKYQIRPFEVRWCYYSPTRPLWNEPRPNLWMQCWDGNKFLVSRVAIAKRKEGSPFYFVSGLFDDHMLTPDASGFPLRLKRSTQKQRQSSAQPGLAFSEKIEANLSKSAREYLNSLHLGDPDKKEETAKLIWMHALAIGYSPKYLSENADGIRQDWPRIPLPNKKNRLLHSGELGEQIASLLDLETPVRGLNEGKIRPELNCIAPVKKTGANSIDPRSDDLKLNAGWGYVNKDGIVMPGKGQLIERDYTANELNEIKKGAELLKLSVSETIAQLGMTTFDVYINDSVLWQNLPSKVWNYHIGGYQVIKKWLSYREETILKRALTSTEVREVTNIARRITSILLLEPILDSNYDEIKREIYHWSEINSA